MLGRRRIGKVHQGQQGLGLEPQRDCAYLSARAHWVWWGEQWKIHRDPGLDPSGQTIPCNSASLGYLSQRVACLTSLGLPDFCTTPQQEHWGQTWAWAWKPPQQLGAAVLQSREGEKGERGACVTQSLSLCLWLGS